MGKGQQLRRRSQTEAQAEKAQAEKAQRQQAEEERRQQAEEERRRQAEEEQRRQAEEEQRRQAEAERRRQAEAERRRPAKKQQRQAGGAQRPLRGAATEDAAAPPLAEGAAAKYERPEDDIEAVRRRATAWAIKQNQEAAKKRKQAEEEHQQAAEAEKERDEEDKARLEFIEPFKNKCYRATFRIYAESYSRKELEEHFRAQLVMNYCLGQYEHGAGERRAAAHVISAEIMREIEKHVSAMVEQLELERSSREPGKMFWPAEGAIEQSTKVFAPLYPPVFARMIEKGKLGASPLNFGAPPARGEKD